MKTRRKPLLDENIPDINFFKRGFKKLRRLLEDEKRNLTEPTFEEIKKELLNSLGMLPAYVQQVQTSEKHTFIGFRVISHKEIKKNGLPLNSVDTFSHPPCKIALAGRSIEAPAGRCGCYVPFRNDKLLSVFYWMHISLK